MLLLFGAISVDEHLRRWDQSYLGPVDGEYSYPSDPYRPHTLEQQPPPYDILDPFASPEDDFSGDVDNYRGVDPRSLLYKYMGDLYRDATDAIGEPSHGAGSELGGGGGVAFGSEYRALY